MILSILAAAVLMAGSPAPASGATTTTTTTNTGAPGAAQPPLAKAGNNGMICRKEPLLGSKMPKKVCFSPEQLAQRTQDDKDNLGKMQRETQAPLSN